MKVDKEIFYHTPRVPVLKNVYTSQDLSLGLAYTQ